jgi:transposase-like protein
MDKVTISTFQLFQMFPDAESARLYFEARRWPNGVRCPVCESGERITTRAGGFYRCNSCNEDFTVRTGTIFERSHVPLHKWLYAMYLLVTARKGISSLQLSKQIGVTQKTAWFMLHRLREACGGDSGLGKLRGIVEVDETHVGGIEGNKHERKKLHAGRGTVGKAPIIGLGSTIHTDEAAAYANLGGLFFGHHAVNHGAGEYARGNVSVNGIESVWAVLKRGIIGVYHHVSRKHLGRYAHEFAFRLNEGNVRRHTFDRLDSLIAATVGRRLTYARLTA